MATLATFLFTVSAMTAGHKNHMTIPILVILAVLIILGCMFGDTFDYFTGYFAESALEKVRWLHRFYDPEKMQQGNEFFKKYGAFSIVIASCVPVLHSCVSLASGGLKYPYWKFIAWNTGSNIVITILCTLGGYFLGHISFIRGHLLLILTIGMLLFIVPGFIVFYIQNKNFKNKKSE